ncbi:MAG: hypothetical protein V4755_07230 [Curtobacterium sp.]
MSAPLVAIEHAPRNGDLAPLMATLRERADRHEAQSRSPRTRELYAADLRDFTAWCRMVSLRPLPADAETVALYITHLSSMLRSDGGARYKPSSIARKLAAIAAAHRDAGYESPTTADRVRRVMAGIRRVGDSTVAMMWPLMTDDVRAIVLSMSHHTWPAGVKAARDTAAFVIGLESALRRSNVSALQTEDVSLTEHGVRLEIRGSKTDQHGVGLPLTVPYGRHAVSCPACAWVRWSRIVAEQDAGRDPMPLVLATAPAANWEDVGHLCRSVDPGKLQSGRPAFRRVTAYGLVRADRIGGDGLYRALLARLEAIGRPTEHFGFHSLRTGFVTQARRNGASRRQVRLQTWHGSDARIDLYDREFNPLAGGNAATMIDL